MNIRYKVMCPEYKFDVCHRRRCAILDIYRD